MDFLQTWFVILTKQIVSMIEKTSRNTNLVASRDIRREKDSLPVDVRHLTRCLARTLYKETWSCNAFININCNSSRALWLLIRWFSNRTGTSVDDGARKSNNWLDRWLSGKLGTGGRVKSFSRTLLSSNDVPALLLNQPNSEFKLEDARNKRTAKRLCLRNVTGLLIVCFAVIFS